LLSPTFSFFSAATGLTRLPNGPVETATAEPVVNPGPDYNDDLAFGARHGPLH